MYLIKTDQVTSLQFSGWDHNKFLKFYREKRKHFSIDIVLATKITNFG